MAWLDKIDGQSLPFTATYEVKIRYEGFLPLVEMTWLSSYVTFSIQQKLYGGQRPALSLSNGSAVGGRIFKGES